MESLLKLLILPLAISKTTSAADDEVEIADLDEAAAGLGYQASFSKLGASEKPKEDPVAWCKDPKEWLAKGLQAASASQPGKVSEHSINHRRCRRTQLIEEIFPYSFLPLCKPSTLNSRLLSLNTSPRTVSISHSPYDQKKNKVFQSFFHIFSSLSSSFFWLHL
jgi:hypothetical protein